MELAHGEFWGSLVTELSMSEMQIWHSKINRPGGCVTRATSSSQCGELAHMVERPLRMREVRGSIPWFSNQFNRFVFFHQVLCLATLVLCTEFSKASH